MAINKNFVIRNGLEVSDDLIYADADLNKVGIGTTTPNYTLDVNGIIAADDLYVAGLGNAGQYLRSTGFGVTWSSTSTLFQSVSQTATESQTIFNIDYSVGLLEVYLNGVRLTSSEFTATDGETVVLNDGAFEGDTLDFVTYSALSNFTQNLPNSYWDAGEVGIHTLSNVGIGTTIATSTLTVFGNAEVSGIVTATQGFISVGNTTPIQISLNGNQLSFTAVGIGSTTFLLS